MTPKKKKVWKKEIYGKYFNGSTPFPLRQVSEIFFNDEVLTLENDQP